MTVYSMHLVSICQSFLTVVLLHAEMCVVMRLLFICSAQGEGLLIYAEVLYHLLSPEGALCLTNRQNGRQIKTPALSDLTHSFPLIITLKMATRLSGRNYALNSDITHPVRLRCL